MPAGVAAATVLTMLGASACIDSAAPPAPSYDLVTGRLVRLDVDGNGDGFVEQRTYLDGNVPFRSEVDADADGRVERWEYVDDRGRVVKVGSSSAGDGIEDAWVYAAEENGERLVERSSERTARVDRREIFRDRELTRVEEDTNQDGLIDKWESYEAGIVRTLAYDARKAGRPDRRVFFDAQGRFVRLELDEDGDGRFEAAAPGVAAALPNR